MKTILLILCFASTTLAADHGKITHTTKNKIYIKNTGHRPSNDWSLTFQNKSVSVPTIQPNKIISISKPNWASFTLIDTKGRVLDSH